MIKYTRYSCVQYFFSFLSGLTWERGNRWKIGTLATRCLNSVPSHDGCSLFIFNKVEHSVWFAHPAPTEPTVPRFLNIVYFALLASPE